MLNKWAQIEELRLQEENPFEYKLMQKTERLDNYLEQFGKDAAEQARISKKVWMQRRVPR